MLRNRDLEIHQLGVNPLRATANARNFFTKERFEITDLAMVLLIADAQRETFLPYTLIDGLDEFIDEIYDSGIRSVKLFTSGVSKTKDASEAFSDINITNKAIKTIKTRHSDIYVMTENCLCPYTSHGSCAIHKDDGSVDFESTRDAFVKAALKHAESGADAVGPAAMAEGLVGPIRKSLDSAGYRHVAVIPHLIMRSFAFTSYRALMATGDGRHRAAFQIDQTDEAGIVRAAERFVSEGADALLIEPSIHMNDVIKMVIDATKVPMIGFSSSGEYKMMLVDPIKNGSDESAFVEYIMSLKRVGVRLIATYAALQIAERFKHR